MGFSNPDIADITDPESLKRIKETYDRIYSNKKPKKVKKIKTLEDEISELHMMALNKKLNFEELIIDFINENYTRK